MIFLIVVIRAKQEADMAEVILSPFEVSQNNWESLTRRTVMLLGFSRFCDILREFLLLTRIYWLKVVNCLSQLC